MWHYKPIIQTLNKNMILFIYLLVVNANLSNTSAISWREQIVIQMKLYRE